MNNNNNNYDGTYDSQFPIWWCGTNTTATTSDNITFTASTDGSHSGNLLSFTANTSWSNYDNYKVWPKRSARPLN